MDYSCSSRCLPPLCSYHHSPLPLQILAPLVAHSRRTGHVSCPHAAAHPVPPLATPAWLAGCLAGCRHAIFGGVAAAQRAAGRACGSPVWRWPLHPAPHQEHFCEAAPQAAISIPGGKRQRRQPGSQRLPQLLLSCLLLPIRAPRNLTAQIRAVHDDVNPYCQPKLTVLLVPTWLKLTHSLPLRWLLQGITHAVPLESLSASSPLPPTPTPAPVEAVGAAEPAAEGGGAAAQPQRGKQEQGGKQVDEYCIFILQRAEKAAQALAGGELPPPQQQQQGPRRGLPALNASEVAAALVRLDVGPSWAKWGSEMEQAGLPPPQVSRQACGPFGGRLSSLTSVHGRAAVVACLS